MRMMKPHPFRPSYGAFHYFDYRCPTTLPHVLHGDFIILTTFIAAPSRVLRGGRFILLFFFTPISPTLCVSSGAGLFFSLSLPCPLAFCVGWVYSLFY